MKLVNCLVEPTSGTVEVDGEDVARADVRDLRRRIGYVIQQVGLFPHQTVGDNVATVPRLLATPGERVLVLGPCHLVRSDAFTVAASPGVHPGQPSRYCPTRGGPGAW